MFTFEGKNALILGAGKNIGRAIALEFSRRGATVAIGDIDKSLADETASLVRNANGKAIGIQCDVASLESVQRAVEEAEAFCGDIDILINNAGIIHSGNPEDFPPSEWERMFGVNFFGAVRANSIILPKMLQRGTGYIVNTASFAGLYPYATNRIPYAASKAALVSMTENMALYLKPQGIHISYLCPGPIMSNSLEGMKPWSENVVMRGPGSQLKVNTQEHAATTLSEGMIEQKVFIPTHDEGFDIIRHRADNPDRFIQHKLSEFAAGDSGIPGI